MNVVTFIRHLDCSCGKLVLRYFVNTAPAYALMLMFLCSHLLLNFAHACAYALVKTSLFKRLPDYGRAIECLFHIMQFAPVLLRCKVLGSSINVTAVRKIPNVSILFKMKSYSVNILY